MAATHLSGLTISPTNITASSATITEALNGGKVTSLNRAAGQAITLPDATGSGARYEFFIGTSITSNTTTIKVSRAADTMAGSAFVDGTTSTMFQTAATSDTITMNGSTQGGLEGSQLTLTDVAANKWMVSAVLDGSGAEATPFSATV